MTDRHSARIELAEPTPTELPVGSSFAVKFKVTCAAGCDLREMALDIVTPDGAAEAREAAINDVAAARELTLRMPQRVGEQVWQLSLPSQDGAGIRHEADSLIVRVEARPLATSLAVWDIPSPVVQGQPFDIKVGAKSSGNCSLIGRPIEVCDGAGIVVAQASLGATAWPGTEGLYWTIVALAAPVEEGTCSWSVRFAASDLDLPHDAASGSFSIVVTPPPEHRLSVRVVEKDTANPIGDAEIRVGIYRTTTDPSGLATLEVPKGTFDLVVWKVGYDVPPHNTHVTADAAIQVEAVIVPEEDPDAIWQM